MVTLGPTAQAAPKALPLSSAPTRGPRRRLGRHAEHLWGYLLITPLCLGLGVFYLWPLVRTLYYSFTEWGAFGGHQWTGLANYRALAQDPGMVGALRNTFIYAGITLAGIPLAIALAAVMNQRGLRGVGVYRTLYFLPVVTMPAAVALVWRWLYNGDYGLINQLLALVGIHGPAWVSDPRVAIYAVAIVGVWMELGYSLVIFLAALQGLPRDLYEAASLDGAGPVRQFFSITVPLLTPSIFFVSVLTLVRSLQAFDLIYVMLGPTNPATQSSKTIVYLFYETSFIDNDRGYGAAIAFVLLVLIAALTLVQFRLQKRWVHYV